MVKHLRHLYVSPDITYHYCMRPLSICTGTSGTDKAKSFSIIYEDIARHFSPGEDVQEARFYLDSYFRYFWRYPIMDGYKRAYPFFERALAGGESREERLRLWVLRLLSNSAVLRWLIAILLMIRRAILYPFRRLASLWGKVKK